MELPRWNWWRRPDKAVEVEASPVAQACTVLRRLNESTERDFLSLGGQLVRFLEITQQLSSDLTAVIALATGESSREAGHQLEHMAEAFTHLQQRLQGGDTQLLALREAARRIHGCFRSFGQTVTSFHAVGTLTRIETARIQVGAEDLLHLTAEVETLTTEVRLQVERLLETATEFDGEIQPLLEAVARSKAQESGQLPVILEGALAGIRAFSEREQQAARASAGQQAGYSALAADINELVTAIQFHDITRQQVEHVLGALESSPAAESGAGSVLTLQASQLRNAGRTFAESVQQIAGHLEHLGATAQRMAGESEALFGGGQDREQFFLQTERSLHAMMAAAQACQSADGQMREAVSRLALLTERMRRAVEQIGVVELKMHRMSMNAQVRAAHLGGVAAPLSTLAAAMQELAAQTQQRSGEASAVLAELGEGIGCLAAAQPEEVQRWAAGLSGIENTLGQLHSSSEAAYSRSRQIEGLARRFADELAAARAGFTAGEVFARAMEESLDCLRRAGAEAAPVAGAEVTESLAHLAATYTMEAQRQVHAEATGQGGHPAEAPAAVEVASGDSFGENVEFF